MDERKPRKLNRKNLGQHLTADDGLPDVFASRVDNKSTVIEIGPGTGIITRRIARNARRVVCYEVDPRFAEDLDRVMAEHPNVQVTYQNILGVDLRKALKGKSRDQRYQIMSNLPFQISEPLLRKLVDLPIDEAVLTLGRQMTERIQEEDPERPGFGKTGSLVQTFFDVSVVRQVDKRQFKPVPSTDAAIVVLTPKPEKTIRSNPKTSILARLFRTESKHPPVRNVIDEATADINPSGKQRDKGGRNRYGRRQVKQELRQNVKRKTYDQTEVRERVNSMGKKELKKLNIPETILNKPFSDLDNQELRVLVTALERRYGK